MAEKYIPKEGSGSLFHNAEKSSDSAPDWKGSITLGGITYDLALWKGETSRGSKKLSFKIVPMEGQAETVAAPVKGGGVIDMDEDLPF